MLRIRAEDGGIAECSGLLHCAKPDENFVDRSREREEQENLYTYIVTGVPISYPTLHLRMMTDNDTANMRMNVLNRRLRISFLD